MSIEQYQEQYDQLEEVDTDYEISTKESELPIAYRDTRNTEEDVLCIMGHDFDENGTQKADYVAMFQNLTLKEQKMAKLEDLEHLNRFRNELALNGWRMVKNPHMSWNQGQVETKKHRKWVAKQDEKQKKKDARAKKAVDDRKRRMREEVERRKAFIEKMQNEPKE